MRSEEGGCGERGGKEYEQGDAKVSGGEGGNEGNKGQSGGKGG